MCVYTSYFLLVSKRTFLQSILFIKGFQTLSEYFLQKDTTKVFITVFIKVRVL